MRKILLLSAVAALAIAAPDVRLDEVIVSAQKIDENASEVAATVSVLDEKELRLREVKDLNGLRSASSNLSFLQGGGISLFITRGVTSDYAFDSPNVGLYLDGVSYLGTYGNYVFLEDIERIEILKGPQSALYGKNAYAGVINAVSKAPTNEPQAKIGLKLGEHSMRGISFSAGGAIVKDKFLASFAGFSENKNGFMYNENLNKSDDYKDALYGKIYFRFLPTDELTVDLIQNYYRIANGAQRSNLPSAANRTRYANGMEGEENAKNYEASLKAEYKSGDYALTSLTTFRDYKNDSSYDGDHRPASLLDVYYKEDRKDFTQEFRFSADNAYGKFVLGAAAGATQRDVQSSVNSVMFGGIRSLQNNKTRSKNYGVFTHNEIYLPLDFSVILGARFDKDRVKFQNRMNGENLSDSYSALSPKIGLKYAINDEVTAYASVSKGYKPGGFWAASPTSKKWYDKETMTSYEVGVKGAWERFELGAAVFRADIKNKQVVSVIVAPNITVAENASKARSQGFELDGAVLLADGLKLSANLGYAKSVFKDYKDAQGDYSGKYVYYAPRLTYGAGLSYETPSGFYAAAFLRGQSKFYTDKANVVENAGYATVDAKVGFNHKNINVYIYANNLFDKDHDVKYATMHYLSDPREIGVKFEYKF